MDPIQKRELKRQAWRRLAAQRQRAGVLRGRVVVISLICFAVLWGVVFAQMATGNDPVLAAKEATVATRTARAARNEVETTDARELEAERRAQRAQARAEEEASEAEPEAEEVVEAEPEAEEVETEPLVTSQS